MDVRLTLTDCDEAVDYVVPNVLSPRDLISRSDCTTHKTKRDFTVFNTRLDLININYSKMFPTLACTEFMKNEFCKLFLCRITCSFIKNIKSDFFRKFFERPMI